MILPRDINTDARGRRVSNTVESSTRSREAGNMRRHDTLFGSRRADEKLPIYISALRPDSDIISFAYDSRPFRSSTV